MPNELVRKVMAALSSTAQALPDEYPDQQKTSLKLGEEDQARLRHLITSHKNLAQGQSPHTDSCRTSAPYQHHIPPKGSWSLSDLAASKSGKKS